MDANVLPEEQAPVLGHGDGNAERRGQGREQRLRVVGLDDPVATLALLWFLGALELDQVCSPGLLLAKLQPTRRDIEIAVPLPQRAVILRTEDTTYLQGTSRVRVDRLQLDIPPRCCHPPHSALSARAALGRSEALVLPVAQLVSRVDRKDTSSLKGRSPRLGKNAQD